jgi:hypothetical protein
MKFLLLSRGITLFETILQSFYFSVKFFLLFYRKFQNIMANNEPAYYDFLARQKRTPQVCFIGGPKCGGEKPHKGRRPTAVFRSPSPEGAKRKQTCYTQYRPYSIYFNK